MALDDNPTRVQQLIQNISLYDKDIKIDHPTGIRELIHLIETNSYDCIITHDEISILNNFQLKQKISEVLAIPIIRYLGESRLPPSTKTQPEQLHDLKHEDTLSYSLLAERIRKTIKPSPIRSRAIALNLPETPFVEVRGNEIIIINENGEEETWGTESDENIQDVAALMELELKTIQWIRVELERFIGAITETIKDTEVPPSDISDIIYEGYRSLLPQFKKIDQSYNQR